MKGDLGELSVDETRKRVDTVEYWMYYDCAGVLRVLEREFQNRFEAERESIKEAIIK